MLLLPGKLVALSWQPFRLTNVAVRQGSATASDCTLKGHDMTTTKDYAFILCAGDCCPFLSLPFEFRLRLEQKLLTVEVRRVLRSAKPKETETERNKK